MDSSTWCSVGSSHIFRTEPSSAHLTLTWHYRVKEGLHSRTKRLKTMAERLDAAAGAGNLFLVTELIHGGADVNATDKDGWTALMVAAKKGHLEVIRYLVEERGVDVNATTKNGETAMMRASDNGHVEVVRYLVEDCSVDVNATNNRGWTAMMAAALDGHVKVVRYLVEDRSVDVNATNKGGLTAIMKAANNGHVEVVRYLVEDCSVDVNATDNDGWTAMMKAASNGHVEVVRYLVEECGVDVNALDKNGSTAMMFGAKNGRVEVVRYLVEDCSVDVNALDKNGSTAMMFGAKNGRVEVVRYLVEDCSVDVNATNQNGSTAMMAAASNGHVEVVRYLVEERGVDVNALDKNGSTAIMKAANNGHVEVVRYLVEDCSVDVNATDKHGSTAMMFGANNGHDEVVRYLVEERGVDVNATDKNGWTAMMAAANNGHDEVVRYLVEERGVDVNATDKDGSTAMMKAASNGHVELVRYLVEERGVDVNATNKNGKSAIRFATERGHQDIVRYLTVYSQPTIAETKLPNSQLFSIPPYEIALTQLVETNTFGGEYLAKWLDADVVIKLFIPDAAHTSFEEEVQLWKQLRHPNVIKMYGACEAGPGLQFFVCEYADGGSLIEYVKSTPEETRTMWKYLYEAALGLEYLHERGLVHGDLRCSNVLIGSDDLARLASFGLSGAKSGSSSTVGSMRWQAPEILRGEESSPFASDVYSLGMCVLEAVTGKKPWDDIINVEAKRRKTMWIPETEYFSRDALEYPFGEARDLVWRMCCQDPTKRMKLQSVVFELERLMLKGKLGHSQSEHEHEPVYSLDMFKLGEIKELWGMVETCMKSIDNARYHRLFDDLKSLYKYLHESTHHITLLTRFHTLLTEFHTVITMTDEQALAMRLSSTRATSNSIYAFHRRIESLWVALGQPVDDGVAQTDVLRREMFVSGVSDLYLLLRELESDDEKAAFLEVLKREMADQYTPTELETMRKAVESIESKIGKESLVPEWFIPWYELIKNEDECLGVGGFGSVVRAKWLDSEVVVKQVELNGPKGSSLWSNFSSTETISAVGLDRRAESMEMFRREVGIWFGFSHPHVIQLFGACHVGRPFFVCEYATNGTLISYLRNHSDELWQKLYEAALGVQYLHARGVVHGDLKGNNIVIGSDLKAKVTDFGLSSIASDGGEARISAASHWVAPECFVGEPHLTFESDVYSLGMCIVEAMRVVGGEEHSLPWGSLVNEGVRGNAKRRKLPPRPSICTDAQWELVVRMCTFQPEKRITISTVVDELARLSSKKDDETAESPSLELVPGVISAARTVLSEIRDTKYVELWDELEEVYKRMDGFQTSSSSSSKVFCYLVKDAETATLRLRDEKTDVLSSIEKTMAVHSLRRRLVKFVEAYPADEERRQSVLTASW